MTPLSGSCPTFLALLIFGLSCAIVGCGTAEAPSFATTTCAVQPDEARIVSLYRSRCGSCHQPVAPGSEPAEKLHSVMLKHHTRTRLTEREWAAMEAFLAPGQFGRP